MNSHFLVANAKDGTISIIGYAGGQLTVRGLIETGGTKGGPVVVGGAQVFAASANPAGITGFYPTSDTAMLRPYSQTAAQGVPAYLALSPDGRVLVSASYHQGVAEAWSVAENGSLHPLGQPIWHRNLHSLAWSADGQFCYLISLGEDAIITCRLVTEGQDRASGLVEVPGGIASAPAGSGPRHLLLSPDQQLIYVVTEYSGEVLVYQRDTESGIPHLVQRMRCVDNPELQHSRFGADPKAEGLIWGADLQLSPTGELLYTSERTGSTISALRVNADGSLAELLATSPVVTQPRGFIVLGDTNLLVASETDQLVGLYRSGELGHLTLIETCPVGLGANWLAEFRIGF